MNKVDLEYFRLLNLVLQEGRVKDNRTGIKTIGMFGAQAKFDLQDGFPLLTTKKVFFRSIVHELLWFLSGSNNIKYLVDNDVHIWDDWAYAKYKKGGWTEDELKFSSDAGIVLYSQKEFIEQIKSNPKFAEKWGNLGEGTYSGMWRAFPYYESKNHETFDFDGRPYTKTYTKIDHVDQIQKVIDKLKSNPDDRRLIVSAWHPHLVDHCALPPCHCLFQFHTEELTLKERLSLIKIEEPELDEDGHIIVERMDRTYTIDEAGQHAYCDSLGIPRRRLNCQLYQRSCDLFLGVPFNIASYSLLTCMLAQVVGMAPGTFVHTYGDLHLYTNHLDQVQEQLSREPYELPKLKLNPEVKNLFDFKYEDISIEDYKCHPAIKAEVAV